MSVFNVLQENFRNDARGGGVHCKAVHLCNCFAIVLEIVLFSNYVIPV
jgi:sRNA-binding regulator protein Hfq